MCIWSIELIWYQHMEKWKKIPHSEQNSSTCTGTGQSYAGTSSVMFFYSDQCSYFDHNLLIYDPI